MLQPKPIRAPQPISNPPMPAASRDFAGGQADAAKGFVAAAAAMAPNSIPKSVRLDVSVSTESVSRSEEHTSELQSLRQLVCRLLLEKKKSDESDTSPFMVGLEPAGTIGLFRTQPAPPPVPETIVPNVFTKFLEPEIKEGLVPVDENAQRILVRISGEGMFASGSDKLDPEFVPLMERVGKAMEGAPGNAVSIGQTDS